MPERSAKGTRATRGARGKGGRGGKGGQGDGPMGTDISSRPTRSGVPKISCADQEKKKAKEKAKKEKARKEKARKLATAKAEKAFEKMGRMKAHMEAKEAALALSEEGAVNAPSKEGEGKWFQAGGEKRGKKVEAVTNTGVVTSRGGTAKGETKLSQTPVQRRQDTKKRVQTTSPIRGPHRSQLVPRVSGGGRGDAEGFNPGWETTFLPGHRRYFPSPDHGYGRPVQGPTQTGYHGHECASALQLGSSGR